MNQLTTCPVCENETSYCDLCRPHSRQRGHLPLRAMRGQAVCDFKTAEARARLVPYVDVSVIHEYGLTQRLSNAIRVF